MPSTLDIFCCYARADGELLNKLTTHLMPLQRLGLITIWHDTHIEAGREWEEEINKHLNTAQIILLLISPDFMASEYCYSKEMHRAMQRHEQKDACVIPVLLRPTYWKGAPFEKLQMLPDSAKAVTVWLNEDEAFYNVTERISSVVNELTIKYALNEAKVLYDDQRYEGALIIYEQLIGREPELAPAYLGRGKTLLALERYEESLKAYEKAFQLDPKLANAGFYQDKAQILYQLERYEESLSAYDEAIQCDSLLVGIYIEKAKAFLQLKRYREAVAAYEQAIRLKPDEAEYYVLVGDLLLKMRRLEQAIEMYEQAIRLMPTEAKYYDKKGEILLDLKRFEEALDIYNDLFGIYSEWPLLEFSLYSDKEGQALLGLGRYVEALEIYEDCIRNYPYIDHSDLKFHHRKGKALFGLERYEEALVAYEDAIRLSGADVDPEFYQDKGVVHERLAKIAFGMVGKRRRVLMEKLVELRTLSGHTSRVGSVAISADGQTIVSGGGDKTIKVWDMYSGQELRTLSGHTLTVMSVAISADGQTIVSGSGDKTIKVWGVR
jgi:tetratricopeptide (TPR) repeat protein